MSISKFQELFSIDTTESLHQYCIFSPPRCGSWLTFDIIKSILNTNQISFEEYSHFYHPMEAKRQPLHPIQAPLRLKFFLNELDQTNYIHKLEPNSAIHLNQKVKRQDWQKNLVLKYLNKTNAKIIFLERRNIYDQFLSWIIAHHFGYHRTVARGRITISKELLTLMMYTMDDLKFIKARLNADYLHFYYEDIYYPPVELDHIRKPNSLPQRKLDYITNPELLKDFIDQHFPTLDG